MKNKLNLLVVMALAITTILFGKATPLYAATEKRTTISSSYVDYWEYSSKPGTFKTEYNGEAIDAVIGQRVSYQFPHTYYRGLQPGEKIKSVRVVGGTMGNISSSQYTDAHYQGWTGKPYSEYMTTEQRYVDGSATATINGQAGTGTNPLVNIKVQPKLLPKGQARPLNDSRPGLDGGWRTYATFLVEWEIELAPSDDVLLTVQHYDEKTNRPLTPDTSRWVKKGTTVSESSRSFTRMKYTYSEISDDGGNQIISL